MPQPFLVLIRAAVATTTTAALVSAAPADPAPPPVPGVTPAARPVAAAPAVPPAIPPTLLPPTPLPPPRIVPAPTAPPAVPPAPVAPEVRTPVQLVGATRGTAAVQRALSKVGAPYRWGAAGPNAFDCSGLVSWAYRSSGVSLPRSSQAMSRVGAPVARGELRPGDLVFFYRPVSHVGIYIGNNKIVHASSRKYPVKISDMGRMRYNSARRV